MKDIDAIQTWAETVLLREAYRRLNTPKNDKGDLWGTWLRIPDAVRYCGLSKSYLYNLSSAEAITTYRVGSALLFNRHDLDAYIAKGRKEAQP